MTRTRQTITGSLTANTADTVTHTYIPPSADTHVYSTWGSDHRKTIVDVPTPHFVSLLKCGKFLPLNPVTITTMDREIVAAPIDLLLNRDSDSALVKRVQGSGAGSPAVAIVSLPPIDQSLVDLVVVSAQSNAASFEWDVLTFMAELHKTMELMHDIGVRFNNFAVTLAVEARKARRNPYARFRELWLGSRYGIRPIMYDMLNAAQAMSSTLGDSDIVKGRGKHSTSGSPSLSKTTITNTGPSGKRTTVQTDTMNWERTYRANAYLQLGEAIKHRFGVDALVTAYELVPYSFVVDWFINLGRWVQTLGPSLRGDWLGQCVSIKTYYKYIQHVDHSWSGRPVAGSTWSGNQTGYAYYEEVTEYTRYPYSGIPLPTFNPRLTLPKLIDLVTLFVRGRSRVFQILSRR